MRHLQQAGINRRKGGGRREKRNFCFLPFEEVQDMGPHLPILFRFPLLQFLVNISIPVAVLKQPAATACSCFRLGLTEEVRGDAHEGRALKHVCEMIQLVVLRACPTHEEKKGLFSEFCWGERLYTGEKQASHFRPA